MKSAKLTIWKHQELMVLIGSRALQTLSYQMMTVVVGWHLYKLKSDPLWLGLLGLTEAVPAIISAIFAGYLVDTRRPALLLKITYLLTTLNALLVYVVIALGPSFVSREQTLFCLFFSVFMTGLVRSVSSPAQLSLIPTLISRSQISQVMAFNSSSYTFAQVTGPVLGGLLYSVFGEQMGFAGPTLFSLAAFIFIFKLKPETNHYQPHGLYNKEPMFKVIKDGFHFLFSQKVLISAMLLDMFSVLFGGVVAVLPVFADQVFHVDSFGLGILRASPAIGSILMTLVLSLKPMGVISGLRLLQVVFVFGVCMIGFAFSKNIYWAIFWLMLSGVFDAVSMVIRSTLIQLLTPQKLIGRVTSLSRIFITSSNEIGAFESGLAASAMGLVPSVIFGGIMTILVVLFVAKWNPSLRRTRIEPHGPDLGDRSP